LTIAEELKHDLLQRSTVLVHMLYETGLLQAFVGHGLDDAQIGHQQIAVAETLPPSFYVLHKIFIGQLGKEGRG
jgi:hypothetical protein